MAHYLFQCAYTPEAWATMVKNPQNRLEAVGSVAKRLGGGIEAAWLSFGEYDVVVILEMPDDVSVAAFAAAAASAGHLKSMKTTPLMEVEAMIGALEKASGVVYPLPSG